MSTTTMTDALQAARAYLERGWIPVPLHPYDKAALIRWRVLRMTPPTPADVESWWRRCPDANVGILTGVASQLAVLDLDGPEAIERAAAQGVPDSAPRVQTARGVHVYCAIAAPVRTTTVTPGIELRADGAYAVSPPSVHPTGIRYAWLLPPGDRPLPPLPTWASVAVAQPAHDRGIGWAARVLRGVVEGRRTVTCVRLAGYFLAKGLPVNVVEGILQSWNHRNHPPLPESEVVRTIAGVARLDHERRAEALPHTQDSLLAFLTSPQVQQCTHGERSTYQAICIIEWQRGLLPGDVIYASYRELAAYGGVSRAHMHPVLTRLARRGLIEFTPAGRSAGFFGKAAKIRRVPCPMSQRLHHQ